MAGVRGMISARQVLEQLDDSVWFAAITQATEGNKDVKINIGAIKQYVLDNIDKQALGLDKVDNTSDEDKPLSSAVKEAIQTLQVKEELPQDVHEILRALGVTIDGNDMILDEGENPSSIAV